jgi:hypothetical protein
MNIFGEVALGSERVVQPSTTITISAGIADYIAVPSFEEDHPDVQVIIDPVSPLYSNLADQFLTRDESVDLYRLNSNMGIHRHLRAKGFFYDLSESEIIRSFVDDLSPVFKEQVVVNDSILGVPTFLVLEYPFTMNRRVAEEIGISEDDLPTNLLDLLKFVNSWDELYGDQFYDYAPFGAVEASSYALMNRNPYIGLVLEMYKDTMLAQGGSLRYDTPLFHALLTEIEPWTFKDDKHYERWLEEIPDEEHHLFYSKQVLDHDVFNDLCGENKLRTMPLTKEATPVIAYELEVAVVNPATKQPDLAVNLAEWYVKDCQPELLRILCENRNEPYQLPDYQNTVDELKAYIDQYKESMKFAPPSEQQERADMLTIYENALQNELDNPYAISESDMKEFRTFIAPYLVPRGEGIYESEQVYAETMSLTIKWLSGGLTMSEYTDALDDFLKIVERECM